MPPEPEDGGAPPGGTDGATPPPTHPDTVTAYNPDGSPIELSPEAAAAAYKAGKVGFAQGQRLQVQLGDGRVGSVPGEGLASALGTGARLITPADARQAQLQKQYGGALGTAEAFGLGAARGASFGLSDEGVSALGGGDAADAIKELHPIASGLGEAGGMIGLGAATGGSTALEELSEGTAARFLGEGLGRKVAAHALTGAAEGAYMGGADAVSEDALSDGDHQLTAEKLFASMAEDALYGGGLGAGGALLGAGLGSAGKKLARILDLSPSAKDIEAVAQSQYGYVPKGLGDALVKAQSTLAGGGEDIIREAGVQNQSSEAKALRSSLLDIDSERDDAARDVVDHVNTMLKDGKDLSDEVRGALKRSHLAETVSRDDPEGLAQHARATLTDTMTQVQGMMADGEQFGQDKLLGRMNGELKRISTRLVDAGEAGNTAEQYALLDDTKRAIGSWTRDVKSTSLRSSTDPVSLRQARATYDKLDAIYEGLRANLEEPEVWGKAAIDQRKINEAWTAQIQADKQFKATLASAVGEERFGGKVYAADPAKVSRYVSSLTNPDQDLVHTAITNYVNKTRDLVDAVGTSYDLSAGKMAKVERAKNAADAFHKTLDVIGDKLAKANQLKGLLSQESAPGLGASLIGGFLGHVAGGPAGGAAGAALGHVVSGLSSPGRNIMRLAQLERVMAKTDRQVARSVTTFFDRTRTGARQLAKQSVRVGRSARAEAAVELAKDTLTEHGKEEVKDSLRARFDRASRAGAALAQQPTAAAERIAAQAGDLPSAAPKTSMALGAVATKAAGYLAAVRPSAPPADALTSKPGVPATSEMERYVRVSDTVLHPENALDDLAKGRLTGDQVAALQAVYPQFYGQIRAKVQDTLLGHAAAGKDMSYQQRVQLGTLFGVDAEPSMTPPATAHAQATFSAPPAKAQHGATGAGKPLEQSAGLETPAQALEGGKDPGG